MRIEDVKMVKWVLDDLKGISRRLHTMDEKSCNVGLTEKEEKKVAMLMDDANNMALHLGLKAYHQSDPRGCSLHLIDETMGASNYTDGVVIY